MSSASSASLASAALVRRMKPPPPVAAGRLAAPARSCARAAARAARASRSSARCRCGCPAAGRPAAARRCETCVDRRAPLVPIGSLTTCTVSVWPSKTMLLDRRRRHAARRVVAARRAVAVHVGDVQERGALQADVDERRLHAGQHARHLADVDVADQAALQRALEVQLLHRAVLDDRDARLLGRPVDQDVLHRRCGSRCSSTVGTSTPAPRSSARRLVQRQTHDTGVAARRCARSRPRRRALDRVRAGLAERLAAGHVARRSRRPSSGARSARATRSTRRRALPPRRCDAPPRVSTRCVRPESRRAASRAASAGVGRLAEDARGRAPPSCRRRATGAGGRPRAAGARRAARELGARHALE